MNCLLKHDYFNYVIADNCSKIKHWLCQFGSGKVRIDSFYRDRCHDRVSFLQEHCKVEVITEVISAITLVDVYIYLGNISQWTWTSFVIAHVMVPFSIIRNRHYLTSINSFFSHLFLKIAIHEKLEKERIYFFTIWICGLKESHFEL